MAYCAIEVFLVSLLNNSMEKEENGNRKEKALAGNHTAMLKG